jgi:hypothetical protein
MKSVLVETSLLALSSWNHTRFFPSMWKAEMERHWASGLQYISKNCSARQHQVSRLSPSKRGNSNLMVLGLRPSPECELSRKGWDSPPKLTGGGLGGCGSECGRVCLFGEWVSEFWVGCFLGFLGQSFIRSCTICVRRSTASWVL